MVAVMYRSPLSHWVCMAPGDVATDEHEHGDDERHLARLAEITHVVIVVSRTDDGLLVEVEKADGRPRSVVGRSVRASSAGSSRTPDRSSASVNASAGSFAPCAPRRG